MKSRIILELTGSKENQSNNPNYVLHDELKKIAKELLKSEGYKEEEIQFETNDTNQPKGTRYDVVAIRNGKIDQKIKVLNEATLSDILRLNLYEKVKE